MKQGFMLIELIIATLIASMVAGVLLTALSQSTRVQASVDNVINTSVRIGVIANQLEKDLMGAFLPVQAQQSLDTPSTALKPSEGEGKETDKKEDVGQKGPEKEKPKPIEKIFYSTNKDGTLEMLTFVTNNPLVVYVGKDVGEVKPKVVRVQYSLKLEADKKNSYTLFRQESMELDLEKFKNARAYEVISGIKSCTATFTARIPKQQDKQQSSEQNPPKILYEYKTQNDWVSEQKRGIRDKEKSEFPRIPYSVEIKLLLWDKQDKKDKEFTIVCQIPTDFSPAETEEKQQPEKPKKEADDKGGETPANQPDKVAQNEPSKTPGPIVVNVLQDITKMLGRRNS